MLKKIVHAIKGERLLKQGIIDTNYYMLAQVGSRVIGFLLLPVFARLFTLVEFATYDLFILSSGFLVLLAGLGMDSGVAIKIAENKENKSVLHELLFTTLLINFLMLTLLWLIAFCILFFRIIDNQYDLFLVNGLFLYTLLYQFNYQVYNFMRWLGNAKAAAVINFTSYLIGILSGLGCMLLFENSIANYVTGTVLGSLLGVALSAYQARQFFISQDFTLWSIKGFDETFPSLCANLPFELCDAICRSASDYIFFRTANARIICLGKPGWPGCYVFTADNF